MAKTIKDNYLGGGLSEVFGVIPVDNEEQGKPWVILFVANRCKSNYRIALHLFAYSRGEGRLDTGVTVSWGGDPNNLTAGGNYAVDERSSDWIALF